MIYELGHGRQIENPSWKEILNGLNEFGVTGEEVIMLARSELDYLQAKRITDTDFELEYQEGNEARNWVTTDAELPREKVIQAFQLYFNNDESWKRQFTWRKVVE